MRFRKPERMTKPSAGSDARFPRETRTCSTILKILFWVFFIGVSHVAGSLHKVCGEPSGNERL